MVADGVFPAELLDDSVDFRPECIGVRPRFGVWAHVCGSDLVRGADGGMYVLEDNPRVPSGVSYMLENRLIRMGVPLVEGRDLVVDDHDRVFMRTLGGRERVDVIYRRVDGAFLDPEVFRPDSMLGVPGLMRAWRAGNVGIANAPGAGVADDKVVYAWVPDLIRYHLGEEPEIASVPTWRCMYPPERRHVIENIENLVVKPANESGGQGLLIGDRATRADTIAAIEANPRNWVAQPILSLSTVPTLAGEEVPPRHVDPRPFILSGEEHYVTNGGLTRVALREGSLIVNSSQGGGSKDTWVVERTARG